MPRLDVWLVEQGFFSSRQAAKRAIKEGHVSVNGTTAKASKNISGTECVDVSQAAKDLPVGYQKLAQLDSMTVGTLTVPGGLALDIGSSAGGFLSYLAERDMTAIGIEVSEEFTERLYPLVEGHPGFSLIIGDAFVIDPRVVCGDGCLDLLLVDVTTEPSGTVALIERFLPLLKLGGRLAAAFKDSATTESTFLYVEKLRLMGLTGLVPVVLDNKRHEFHIIGER
jgi:23S rRNA (cytidine1920-2'-O)/16S rRNA (cytidine1409-2'-O)-methyltransferase